MGKRILALAVGTAIFGSGTVLAAPFNSFDPRSMAMGGTGVAVANAATAPFFNPATLSVANKKDDFAAELPIVGARLFDPKDLNQGLKDFKDADLIDQLSASGKTNQQYSNLAGQLLTDTKTGFPAVINKPVQAEIGAATVIGIPSRQYGMAIMANAWTAYGASADLSAHDLNVLNSVRTDCDESSGTYNLAACTADLTSFSSDSKLVVRGITLTEVGISLSREFLIRGMGQPVALGITPKYVKATTVDYSTLIDKANTADIKDSNYTNEQNNMNLDVGAAQDYQNGWRGGLVIKNLIPQEYKFKQFDQQTGKLKLNPEVRAGVSYQNNWFTGALDVDLTENEPVSPFEEKSRYVALGTEFNALDWAQLRLGYRIDTLNGDRNVASAGVGISPFGVHFDLAVAGNSNELGVAAQLGFRF